MNQKELETEYWGTDKILDERDNVVFDFILILGERRW